MSFAAAGPLNHGVSGVVFIVASLLLRPSSKRTYLAGPVIAGSSTAAVREQTRPETERLSVTAGPPQRWTSNIKYHSKVIETSPTDSECLQSASRENEYSRILASEIQVNLSHSCAQSL